jgi:hypothetical protein
MPVKVKRHAVKVSYTLCLGGLSFFLFILLTVTGIFLMFFYRPTVESAYANEQQLETAVSLGSLVRNMHRWAAHLMVLSVFLHMARVFYHGAYKSPREFNWMIGIILLTLTLLLSFTGYLLPWDQLSLWAVTVGTNMMGHAGVRRQRQVRAPRILADPAETLLDGMCCMFALTVRDRRLLGGSLLARPQEAASRVRSRGEETRDRCPRHLLRRSQERRKALGLRSKVKMVRRPRPSR